MAVDLRTIYFVGWMDGWRISAKLGASSNVVPFPSASNLAIASPWADSSSLLPALVASDLLDLNIPMVSRVEAMRVPSIAKARALLHSVIATRPLRAYRDDELLAEQPTWLYRSDTGISPRLRTKMILDDLLFDEASLLAVKRGSEGQILDAIHVPYSRWTTDNAGVVFIDDAAVSPEEVIWIPGPGPGLLDMARDTIVAALSTEQAWAQRVRNPFPAMVIQHTEDIQLDEGEAADFVATVARARRNPDSAVMYVPNGLEVISHQAESTNLFESGRNALRLDFANFLNMPAAVLDGSVSQASLTYSTQEGRRNDFLDLTVPYWAGPIEDALSLDNVVPRGQRVRFDFSDLTTTTAAPSGPIVED